MALGFVSSPTISFSVCSGDVTGNNAALKVNEERCNLLEMIAYLKFLIPIITKMIVPDAEKWF